MNTIKALIGLVIAVVIIACGPPPKTAEEQCRRQLPWKKLGRSQNPDPRLDAIEEMRCDEIGREERQVAREEQHRAEDREERSQARREIIAATKPAPMQSTPRDCAQRSGVYAMRYAEVKGDCGPRKPSVSRVVSQPYYVEPPCSGKIIYSPDNCTVHYESACPEEKLDGVSAVVGDATWSADGSRGKGIESLAIKAGDGRTCTSTYEVTSERQSP